MPGQEFVDSFVRHNYNKPYLGHELSDQPYVQVYCQGNWELFGDWDGTDLKQFNDLIERAATQAWQKDATLQINTNTEILKKVQQLIKEENDRVAQMLLLRLMHCDLGAIQRYPQILIAYI